MKNINEEKVMPRGKEITMIKACEGDSGTLMVKCGV